MKNGILNKTILKILNIFLFILLSGCHSHIQIDWQPPIDHHQVISSSNLDELWSLNDIYINDNPYKKYIDVVNRVVAIQGSTNINSAYGLYAIDIMTGKLLWQVEQNAMATMVTIDKNFYLGESGGGSKITSYDSQSGVMQWDKSFFFSSGIEDLVNYHNSLYAQVATSKHYWLNPGSGKSIYGVEMDSPPFFDYDGCGDKIQSPIYFNDSIVFYTKNVLDEQICSIDSTTGNLNWKQEYNIISNVIVTDIGVVFLVKEGSILSLDLKSGSENELTKITFSDLPFILSSTHDQIQVGNYTVAYDNENHYLIVYLGDSRQLFAFRIEN